MELIKRLINSGNVDELSKKYPDRYYKLTDAGQKELNDNAYVSYMHKNKSMFPGLGVYGMNRKLFRDNPKHLTFRDILWAELNRTSIEFVKERNFGLYRNARLAMYNFLLEEGKYKDAFSRLCEVLYVDLSGMGNEGKGISKKFLFDQMLNSCFPYESSIATLPPATNRWIKDISMKLGIDSSDVLRNYFSTEYNELTKTTPYHIFTPEECTDITIYEYAGEKDKIKKIYSKAKKRLEEQIKNM